MECLHVCWPGVLDITLPMMVGLALVDSLQSNEHQVISRCCLSRSLFNMPDEDLGRWCKSPKWGFGDASACLPDELD
jgi:hypothetical protein